MAYSNEQLRQAVDAVFDNFDADGSGSLDKNQLRNLLNAAMAQMGAGRQVSEEQVNALLEAVDTSGDGRIAKTQLYDIFAKVANQ